MGGSKGSTSTVQSGPPPQVMQQYENVMNLANQVAAQPLQQYTGATLAGFTPMQNQAFQNINNAQGSYQPYFNQASNLINQGTQGYSPQAFNQNSLNQYMSPYTNNVLNSQVALENQQNAQQQQQLTGNAIAQGAFGGDRQAVAASTLAGQQALANNATNANILQQGYNTALNQFNTQNQMGLQSAALNNQSALSGAGLQGALGNYSMNNALAGANAQYGAGSAQQQMVQNQLNIPYQMFQQQQQYPFQTTQWLSNLAEGIGGQMGGSSSTTQPSGNLFSSLLGTGLGIANLGAQGTTLGSLASGLGAFFGMNQGGRVGYADGGSVPDFDLNIVPQESSPIYKNTIPQPVSVDKSSQQNTQLSLNQALAMLAKNSPPVMNAQSATANAVTPMSPTVGTSLANYENNFLQSFGAPTKFARGGSNNGLGVPSGISSGLSQLSNPAIGGLLSGTLSPTTSTTASATPAYAPGSMHEVTDFNPIVAGTPVYAFTPPQNGVNSQAIATLGSTLNPATPLQGKLNNVKAGNFSQFEGALSNPSFVTDFNKLYSNQLTPTLISDVGQTTSGHGNSTRNSPLYPYYQEYQQDPFQWNFASGGEVKGYDDGGGIPSFDLSSIPGNNFGNIRNPSGGFMTYPNPEAGLSAMRQDLMAKVTGHSPAMSSVYGSGYTPTLRKLISVYAPPSENNTDQYIQKVSSATGIGPDDPLTQDQVDKILPAMAAQENGPMAGRYAAWAENIPYTSPGGMTPNPMMKSPVPNNAPPQAGLSPTGNPQQGLPSDLQSLESQLQAGEPKVDPRNAIGYAGWSMAAGKSPYALQNIGAGMAAGMQQLQQQKQLQMEYRMKEFEVEKAAEQMQMQADWHKQEMELWGRKMNNANQEIKQNPDGTYSTINKATGEASPVSVGQANNLINSGQAIQDSPANQIQGGKPNHIQQVMMDAGESPTPAPILDKEQVKTNSQDYNDANKAYNAARNSKMIAQQALQHLDNYKSGPMADTRANIEGGVENALGMQTSEDVTNTQLLQKYNKQMAQLISQSLPKGSRIGAFFDIWLASSTFNPEMNKEANTVIINNSMKGSDIAKQILNLQVATRHMNAGQKNAVEQSFFDDNPMMVPSTVKDADGKNIMQVNPAYSDPDMFKKWSEGGTPQREFPTEKEGMFFTKGGKRFQVINGQGVPVGG